MPLERRQHVRMPSYLGARLHLHHLNSSLDCVVRNMSPSGCRLVFPNPVLLPAAFDLLVTARNQLFRARVIWRSDLEAGIVFEAPEQHKAEPISLDMARRIKRLETEKANLQRRVDDLSNPA